MSPSDPGPEHLLLVRLAPELTTKSRRTRRRFQERLVHNIRDLLSARGGAHRVSNRWDRIHVEVGDPDAAADVADVFGVSSVSVVDARIPASLERIVETGEALYHDRVRGRTFAVKARRSGNQDFRSQDVRVQLGAALNPGAEVDLDDPDVTVSVEVRDDEAFLFCGRVDGVGGLPLGVEGKAVCLLSGGFDSAVAAWLLLRRGVSLDYVFCNLAGDAYERMVASIGRALCDRWSHGDRPRLHVVDFVETVEHLKESVEPRYWQVVLKRLMYRAAEGVAADVGGQAVVTGESLGQVSSQTLGNLRAIDAVADLPVFRPLVGYDKDEIIRRAERIGTAALSARVREYCAILPDRPVTNATPERVRSFESRLSLEPLERAVEGRRVLDLKALTPGELVEPYIFTDEVPGGAVVFDCRSAPRYRSWHWPGAERRAPHEVAARVKELSKERTYVLYCDRGAQTAHLAEILQRAGYEAYSFRGGTAALKRYLEREGTPAAAPGGT